MVGPALSRTAWRWLARLRALMCATIVVGLGFSASAALAQVTTYSNTTASAVNGISDTATPCSNPLVRTFTVSTSYTVSDVNIGVLLAHTYRSDLRMTLQSPAGTRVTFMNGHGGAADNYNVLHDDEAGVAITGHTANDTVTGASSAPPYQRTYNPASPLSAFDGQTSLGTWRLEICDAVAQDSGTFYRADLYLQQTPATYADLSLTKTVSAASPTAGAAISYTLTVRNAAASALTATGVTVADTLPAGFAFTGASGSGSYNSTTGIWSVGTLAPNASATVTISGTVSATSGATITNYAEIATSSVVDLDSTPGNLSTSEDDNASVSFTVSGTRIAGTPPVLTCPAGTTLFDWDTVAWTAGSLSNSYAVTALGTIQWTITNEGAWSTNATYGGLSPARQNVVNGGNASAGYSLFQLIDFATQAQIATTTVALPTAVPGLQFTIFDVDYNANQFADRVRVTGTFNGVAVSPTLTNGTANYVIGNSAYGDQLSADTSANGNVVVTFASPVDTVVIEYGNHSLAPADPGGQAIAIHDITFCRPQATVLFDKSSSIVSDPVNGTTNPKFIPGAVVRYCLLVTNSGSATATTMVVTDTLPANLTYVAGSMASGADCAGATTAEDDNNSGSDESDPYGASIAGATITAIAPSLAPASGFATVFRATVN